MPRPPQVRRAVAEAQHQPAAGYRSRDRCLAVGQERQGWQPGVVAEQGLLGIGAAVPLGEEKLRGLRVDIGMQGYWDMGIYIDA